MSLAVKVLILESFNCKLSNQSYYEEPSIIFDVYSIM